MPRRKVYFYPEKIYHLYNKTIDKKKIFRNTSTISLFKNIFLYYRSSNSKKKRYSEFLNLDIKTQKTFYQQINDPTSFYFDCLAYCFMPNHFHFLIKLRPIDNLNFSAIFRKILISFTRNFNQLNSREGPIFLMQFKAVLIESEEQLIHTSRYIHLNPYSAGLVSNLPNLLKYKHSSLKNYLTDLKSNVCDPSYILSLFDNNKQKYKTFVFERADYQRLLQKAKQLANPKCNLKHVGGNPL